MWERATSAEGIDGELMPLLRMTMPDTAGCAEPTGAAILPDP